MATATDVAHWMLELLERQGGWLAEQDAVARIPNLFGPEFVVRTPNGELQVNLSVQDAFGQLTAGTVEWSPEDRAWTYPNDGGRLA